MYNTIIALAVLLDAYLWLAVINAIWNKLSERSVRKTDERREKYRAKAYKAVRERQVKQSNRENLWRTMK